MSRRLATSLVVAMLAPTLAHADSGTSTAVPPVPSPPPGGDIEIETPGQRSIANEVVLGALTVAGLAVGGVGVAYNLQARSDARALSTSGAVGVTWTPARAAKQSQIHTDNVGAGICYGVGGALVLSAAIALIVTQPASTTTVIHPRSAGQPVVEPTSGGAVVGGRWSF